MLGTLWAYVKKPPNANKFVKRFDAGDPTFLQDLTLEILRRPITRTPYKGMTLLTYLWIRGHSDFLQQLFTKFTNENESENKIQITDITHTVAEGPWQGTSILSWTVHFCVVPIKEKGEIFSLAQSLFKHFKEDIKPHYFLGGSLVNPTALWWAFAGVPSSTYAVGYIWSYFGKQLTAAPMRVISGVQPLSPRMPLWFVAKGVHDNHPLMMDVIVYFLTQGEEFFSESDLAHTPEGEAPISQLLENFLKEEKWQTLLQTRQVLFKYIQECDENKSIAQNDKIELTTLADNAADAGYYGAFYVVGRLFAKYKCIEQAVESFMKVEQASDNYEEANRTGASLTYAHALTLEKEKAIPFLHTVLYFAHSCQQEMRDIFVTEVGNLYLQEEENENISSPFEFAFPSSNEFESKEAFVEYCFEQFDAKKSQNLFEDESEFYAENPLNLVNDAQTLLFQFNPNPSLEYYMDNIANPDNSDNKGKEDTDNEIGENQNKLKTKQRC